MNETTTIESIQLKNQIKEIIEISYRARQGHLSSALSILPMINVLYKKIMKFNPNDPDSLQNDSLIVSKGHASLALYVVLNELGCISKEELYSFSQYDSILGEHPDRNKVPGVSISTGSLGHGLPCGVGMAIGYKAQKYDNRVFVIVGDGECNEGSVWEAANVASIKELDNLVCIGDDNNSASHTRELGSKFESFGWEVCEVDGTDTNELEKAINKEHKKPLFVWAHTIKGYGCEIMQKDPEGWHHRVISDQEYKALMEELK